MYCEQLFKCTIINNLLNAKCLQTKMEKELKKLKFVNCFKTFALHDEIIYMLDCCYFSDFLYRVNNYFFIHTYNYYFISRHLPQQRHTIRRRRVCG